MRVCFEMPPVGSAFICLVSALFEFFFQCFLQHIGKSAARCWNRAGTVASLQPHFPKRFDFRHFGQPDEPSSADEANSSWCDLRVPDWFSHSRPGSHGISFQNEHTWKFNVSKVSAFPAVLRFNVHYSLPFFTAFYHAYIELVVTNTFMAASVFIVCFMTLDRYFSVCRPTEFKNFHTRRNCVWAISVSYILGKIYNLSYLKNSLPGNIGCQNMVKKRQIVRKIKGSRETTSKNW